LPTYILERGSDVAERKNSAAKLRANAKYDEKAYDKFLMRVAKGRKAELQAHAADQGESLNKFVNRAIDETVERDNAKGDSANP
jgi:predicted HicB family RNase H-like nuclease